MDNIFDTDKKTTHFGNRANSVISEDLPFNPVNRRNASTASLQHMIDDEGDMSDVNLKMNEIPFRSVKSTSKLQQPVD